MVLSEARGLVYFWLSEAAYRVMGDSVPKHTGPISLTDTHPEPSVAENRPTTTRESPEMERPATRDAQAACRCNCRVETYSFLPNR